MTWPQQTVTKNKESIGHLILRYNAGLTSQAVISRLCKITSPNFAPQYYNSMHFSADGQERPLYKFQVAPGSGELTFTLDEIYDVDTVAWSAITTSPVPTPLVNVDLCGFYPANPTKGWRILWASAFIVPVKLDVTDFKKPAEFEWKIEPMGVAGTSTLYIFDDNYTL